MANEYYDHSNYPQQGAFGLSSQLRAELELIEAGFSKLLALSTHVNQIPYVNAGGTAMEGSANFSFNGSTLTLQGFLAGTGLTIVSPAITNPTISGAVLSSPAISGGVIAGAAISGGTLTGLTSPLPIASGGTGATSAAAALAALGGLPLTGGTLSAGLTITTGGLTVTAGGLTVTAGTLAVTGGTITLGGNTLATGVYNGSNTWSPSIANGASGSVQVTVTGAAEGDFAVASFGSGHGMATANFDVSARVYAANSVQVTVTNNTGILWAPGSHTVYVKVFKRA